MRIHATSVETSSTETEKPGTYNAGNTPTSTSQATVTSDKAVQTGDATNIVGNASAFGLAGLVLALKKKSKKNKK